LRKLAFTCVLPFLTALGVGAQEPPLPDTVVADTAVAADTTVVRGP
jgi:hypothetical protein